MSSTRDPRKLGWMRLLRLAKFFASHGEIDWIMPVQNMLEKYVVFGDSDWRGSKSRRSTSRTFEQSGSNPNDNGWSKKNVIALSNGEAELYAAGRAAAGGLQSVQLLAEAGLKLKLEVLTDSTASNGMHSCVGSGRVRHLDVRWVWAQEAVQAERFSLKQVGTFENVSDLTTKYQDEESLGALMRMGGVRLTRGRQLAAFVVTRVVDESQTVAANAIECEDIIMGVGRWIACLVTQAVGM